MLDFLLYPKSIAVIGASRTPGKVGYEVLANLIEGGFEGQILSVNPSASEILGLSCLDDLNKCKDNIDLAIITLPAQSVLKAVESSTKAGAKAIAVVTAGFRETGAEGTKLQSEIAKLCAQAGARLLGPNCLGLI